MQKGIVIREQHGKVAWEKVKKEIGNLDNFFVMLCLGETRENGSDRKLGMWQKNIWFDYHADMCEELGISYGIYGKAQAQTVTEAKREAEVMLKALEQRSHIPASAPIFIKPEAQTVMLTLTQEERGNIMEEYGKSLLDRGYIPGICANKYWCTHLLTDERICNWKKWIIQHYKECTFPGEYAIWQYFSMGSCDGIQGCVELLEAHTGHKLESDELPNLHGYVGTSLVGALNQKGYPSEYSVRERYAVRSGIVKTPQEYRGTSKQNRELLRCLGGTLSASRILRAGSWIRLKPNSCELISKKPWGAEMYQNTFQIMEVSGTTITIGIQGKVIGKVNRHAVVVA